MRLYRSIVGMTKVESDAISWIGRRLSIIQMLPAPECFTASVYIDQQSARENQHALDGDDKGGGVLFLPDVKIYHKVFIMKMAWYCKGDERMEES